MTQDLLAELRAYTPKLKSAVETVRLDAAATKALNTLRSVSGQADRFSACVAAIKILDRKRDRTVREALIKAAGKASDIGEALEEAADSDGVRAAEYAYHDGFGGALHELETAVRNAWSEQARSEFEPLRGMGELLERIPDTAGLGHRLTALGQEARDLVGTRPPLPELNTKLERLCPAAAALRQELSHVGDDDPEVTAFLRAMATNQARASHLTHSVWKWLEKCGALGVFAVRAAD